MSIMNGSKLRIPAIMVCAMAVSAPAYALDNDAVEAAIGGGLGGALGAVIGNEIGGENGAILGGVIGVASGTAIIMNGSDGDHSRNVGHWGRDWGDGEWDDGEWEEDD